MYRFDDPGTLHNHVDSLAVPSDELYMEGDHRFYQFGLGV